MLLDCTDNRGDMRSARQCCDLVIVLPVHIRAYFHTGEYIARLYLRFHFAGGSAIHRQ